VEFIRAVTLLAGHTLRELIRSKLLYNLLIFALLLIASSMFVAQLTIGQWDRIILDMGLAAIELSGVLIAVLIGIGLVAGEIDRRTIFPTLAKPVSRGAFLLGRYLGLLVMLGINVLIMMAALAAVLSAATYGVSATAAAAALLIFVELGVVAAAAMFFGSFTTPVLASAFSLAFFLIGHLLADLKAFRERSESGLAKSVTGALYHLLPNLELFNLKSEAANGLPAPAGFTSSAALYGCVYAATLLLLAIGVFSRRDLK
jgi:ABC-type transport system involved in multi-copper enzyme maturation permease subunit